MVQREVAERVARRAGRDVATCRCSSSTTRRRGSRSGCRASAFEPAPKVESAVLVLEPYPGRRPARRGRPRTHLWRVVQAGFRERRKMLHNVLTRQLPIEPRARRRGARRRRHRPRPAAADRRGGGVDRARRGARRRSRKPGDAGAVADDPADADADRRLAPVIRLAPAKVNLTLAVLARGADGFHDLHSVMVPLDLADRLSRLGAAARDGRHPPRRRLRPRARVADNLVLRAIAAARRARRGDLGPSSTAAAARRAPGQADPGRGGPGRRIVRRRGGGRRGARGLGRRPRRRGRGTGSPPSSGRDVPFFLAGGPALVEGRGERVTPLGWLRDAAPTAGAIARACCS